MTTDLDALIAEARSYGGFSDVQDFASDALETLTEMADALESTLAELRQERERADGWREEFLETAQEVKLMAAARDKAASQRNSAWRQRDDERAAKEGNARLLNVYAERLSRAEETIEKVRSRHQWVTGVSPSYCICGVTFCETATILTEYDKQKEADRGSPSGGPEPLEGT